MLIFNTDKKKILQLHKKNEAKLKEEEWHHTYM